MREADMSDAVQVIENIIKIGTILKGAAEGKPNASDLVALLASDEFKTTRQTIEGLIGKLSNDGIAATIQRIQQKQQALLASAGGEIAKLPTDKILQYAQLGDTRVVLAANEVKVAFDKNFLQWLTRDALPVLLRTAPVVLPLIL
jgi:hypothetical protein